MEHQQETLDPATPPALVQRALDAHYNVGKVMMVLHAPEWLLLDLSMAQLKVLLLLDAEQNLTIGQVARKMGFTKPTTSILVDKLVQGDYILRTEDAEDRRRTILQLTEKGTELAASLLRGKRTLMCALLSAMPPADLQALTQGWEALTRVAKAQCANCPQPEPVTIISHSGAQASAKE